MMLTLCRMREGDAEEIKSWPTYRGVHQQMDYALRDNGWLDVFAAAPNTFCYLARESDNLVGFGVLIGIGQEVEMRLAVHPHQLGRGVGRALAEALAGKAFVEHEVGKLHLIVRKNNLVALELYRSMGFCRIGTTTRLIMGARVSFLAFVMSRDQFMQKRKIK